MYHNIRVSQDRSSDRPQAWVVPLTQPGSPTPIGQKRVDQAIKLAVSRAECSSEVGCTQIIDPPESCGVRVILVGLGPTDRIDRVAWRTAGAAVVRTAFSAKLTRLRWARLKGGAGPADVGEAIGDGVSLANFSFTDCHGTANRPKTVDKPINLSLEIEGSVRANAALRRALLIGQCVSTARTLAATPPNIANPPYISRICRSLARRTGLRCTLINQAKATQLKMGGILAVGGGGSAPPVMIELEWRPQGTARKPPVLLVGKAVTFDTGGYSLKPGGGKGMKYDKCGGMAVIGIMEAVARLKLKQRVVALIPCVENMIDKSAYRVDDILTLANGVTCEVTNTDAEGRLILADALAYGTKQYKPRAVIDLATLTGGVVTALGPYCAGMYATDDKLVAQLTAAGDITGERLWRLPLWDEVRDLMKGHHSDLVNSASQRWAHPGQGAAFLSYFVGKDGPTKMPTLPWAHLDIAGTASTDSDTPLCTKGPTGFGVRLIVQWLRDLE